MTTIQKFNRVFIMTNETVLNHKWDSYMLCKPFKKPMPSGHAFEFDRLSHHQVYVDQNVSCNEFIIMLKQRFYRDCDNIDLEDIWLYRINQTLIQNNRHQMRSNFFKITYDLKNIFDVPLFSRNLPIV